jgi:3-phenylpropionate/cinnamic acid dioxygenase small subunit
MAGMGNMELRQEVEVFLFEEARLLDKWQLDEWLDLFTADTRYWMPMRETLPASEKPPEPGDLAYVLLDEDKGSLIARVTRLNTGLAHVEEPRSFTRHMVSNVLVRETEKPDEVIAESNIMVFQVHRRGHEYLYVGSREDLLRRVNGWWRIAQRKIYLDQLVLPRAISIFF